MRRRKPQSINRSVCKISWTFVERSQWKGGKGGGNGGGGVSYSYSVTDREEKRRENQRDVISC